MSASILIVEDEEPLQVLLSYNLEAEGYRPRTATSGEEVPLLITEERPDLIILDWMLPGISGIEVCRLSRARPETRDIPIVMLTARGEVTDRIVGLELGADDYLPKPFEPRELVARIQAVLRRGQAGQAAVVRVGELEVNATTRSARLRGADLELTGAEFELLALLVRNRGRVLSRDRIMDETRGVDWDAYDRSIDILVSRLRQKLGDDAKRPRFIRTIRGSGYRFIGGGDA